MNDQQNNNEELLNKSNNDLNNSQKSKPLNQKLTSSITDSRSVKHENQIEDNFEVKTNTSPLNPKSRCFLFLQGPHGHFYKEFSKRLSMLGFKNYHICVNGGDLVDRLLSNCYFFSNTRDHWSIYLNNFLKKHQITDLIVYGDKRYYHTTAIIIAQHLNINVWVFEEGYLRSSYVTLEQNGVNSNSKIPELYLHAFDQLKIEIPQDLDFFKSISSTSYTQDQNELFQKATKTQNDQNTPNSQNTPNCYTSSIFDHAQSDQSTRDLGKLAQDQNLNNSNNNIEHLGSNTLPHNTNNSNQASQSNINFNNINKIKINTIDQNKAKDPSNNLTHTDLLFNKKLNLITDPDELILKCPMHVRVNAAIKYYLGIFFLYPLFPFYKWHRDQGFTSEILGWGLRKIKDLLFRNHNKRIKELISSGECKYFAFPLQLSSDAQIKCASSFRDLTDAIECVLNSFCGYADQKHHLIIKLHPLDNTFYNYHKYIDLLAQSLNIQDRVHYLTECNSNEFIQNSIGMVVVNSTMGILSLKNLKPTITLGNAIYANKGLASSGISNGVFNPELLNQFWKNPQAPNIYAVNLFFKILKEHSLVCGNFYTKEGIALTISNTLERIKLGGIRYCTILSKGIRKIPNLDLFLSNINEYCVIGWGYKKSAKRAIAYAEKNDLPYYALEDGFIKSYSEGFQSSDQKIYSLILDRSGVYYNVKHTSDLESYILNHEQWFTEQMKADAQSLIKKILDHEIVKYNLKSYIPLDQVDLPLSTDHLYNRVLLIDQTYGDESIKQGNASKRDFDLMLDQAITKFTANNVWVKVHPNVINKKAKGYYSLRKLRKKGVHIISANINSIALLKRFKNVYTVTSGTGFEALLCGCHVTCYGEPFYSGYGLTLDLKTIAKSKRLDLMKTPMNLELLVAAMFFKYSIFIDPNERRLITANDAIDLIIKEQKKNEIIQDPNKIKRN